MFQRDCPGVASCGGARARLSACSVCAGGGVVRGHARSAGGLASCVARVSDSIASTVERVGNLVADAKVAHLDETGSRVDGRLCWMHTASHTRVAHLDLYDRCGASAMTDIGILPRFEGVAVHDGWHTYRTFADATPVLCKAHHVRELAGIHEHYDQARDDEMGDLLREMKHALGAAPFPRRDLRSSTASTETASSVSGS